ncbi:MAG: AraC family transcriptional regulator [Clostridiales bacterium]|nr:AraC family transcriptional regulator [Clostridiales bacterium]
MADSYRALYPTIELENTIEIDKIVSIYYFEYAKDFVFQGEKHDFWEFLYVDKGQAEVMADTEGYKLEEGDIIFHKPDEFHSVWANGRIAPNLIIMSFVCNSPAMKFFENKILRIETNEEKNILARIIEERLNTFDVPLYETISPKVMKDSPIVGSQQLIKLYLELFLITLIRNNTYIEKQERISLITRQRVEDDLLNRIIAYMKENVHNNFMIDDLCNEFAIGRTQLKSLFKNKLNTSAMQYFRHLKMEKAKDLIREGRYNFSEIADLLSFSSVNYFSQSFKRIVGMNPSQYADSVKGKIKLQKWS